MSATAVQRDLCTVRVVLVVLALLAGPAWAGNWTIEPVSTTGNLGWSLTLDLAGDGSLFASCLRTDYMLFATARRNGSWGALPPVQIHYYDAALDANDNLFVLTDAYENGQSSLLLWQLMTGGIWERTMLLSSSTGLLPASLAFDAQNRLHVAYRDKAATTLKHMVQTDAGWATRSVVSDPYFTYGNAEVHMALDNRGADHYLWHDNAGQMRHSMWDGTGYVHRSLWPGWGGAMVFDSCNNLHATWFNGSVLKYGRFDGATWTVQILNTPWDRGSIALDIFDRPHIASGASVDNLRLASFTSSTWVFDAITTWPNTAAGPEAQAMVIDRTNRAHIIFADDSKNLRYAYKDLGQHLSLRPVFDVRATSSDGQQFVLTEGAPSILTQQIASSSIYRRGVMEFDLSAIQPGQTVSAAALQLGISGLTSGTNGYPRLHAFGYAGDGVAQPADAGNTASLIGEADVTRLRPVTVALDAAFVDSLAVKSGHLGLVLFDPDTGKQVTFDAVEAGATGPTLVLEYTLQGDINSDGYINVGDLQLLVAAWDGTSTTTPPSGNWNADADLNNDGYVNVGDLQLLVANWGQPVD